MISGQLAGTLGFISIVSLLGGLAWALVSGNLAPFRYLAVGFGLLLAIVTLVLAVSILLDIFGRYERPATVLSAVRARAADSNGRSPIELHFTYEAQGKLRDGYRYAPVSLLLESSELDALLARLETGHAVAYVSYFNADNVVLYRAIGTRSGALVVAAVGAAVLIGVFGFTGKSG